MDFSSPTKKIKITLNFIKKTLPDNASSVIADYTTVVVTKLIIDAMVEFQIDRKLNTITLH